MAIVVNGVTIPTNGDFIVVNGVKVAKVVANGVTVWERVKIKNAPPFKSAGWKLLFKGNGFNDFTEHPNSPWITEDRIFARNTMTDANETAIFCSPTVETAAFTYFSADMGNNTDPDTSEGSAWANFYKVVRFSNDQVNWTDWEASYYANKSYKYAQVGAKWEMYSDSAIEMWYEAWINSVVFYQ